MGDGECLYIGEAKNQGGGGKKGREGPAQRRVGLVGEDHVLDSKEGDSIQEYALNK